MFDDLDDEMNGYLTAIAGTHFAVDLDRILASPTALPTLVAIANIPKEALPRIRSALVALAKVKLNG